MVNAESLAPSDDDEALDDEVVPVREADAVPHMLKPSVRGGIMKLYKIWSDVEPHHIYNC